MQDVIDWLYSGPLLTDILASLIIAVICTYLGIAIIAFILWIITLIVVLTKK